MRVTSKDKIINQSVSAKISQARNLKHDGKLYEAVEMYHKALFLKEDANYLFELAQIYESLMDLSSAVLFYRRVHQLNGSHQAQQKIKMLTKIQGLQLLSIGSSKNILEDTEFESFIKRYPIFHKKMLKKASENAILGDYLLTCLAFLEVNQRQMALCEIENCIMIDDKDVDLLVMHAFIFWSLIEINKGYEQFWNAYGMDKASFEVSLFLEMITPEIQKLYKEAKYDLIDRKVEKCRLKVKKGLEMHPYHTQFLILSAYLYRSKENYEQALADLQLANKHLEDKSLEQELRNQISLTYNEMGIYLYKQGKYNESVTLFSEGLTFRANDWGMLANRGDCYKAQNQFVKALEDYLKAYEIEKKSEELNFRIASIYNIRGIALFNSKNYDLALKQFQESIVFAPKCAQFYLSKGKCLLQLNQKQEAIEAFQKCQNLDDKLQEVSHLLLQLRQPQQRKTKNQRKIIFLSKEK